MSLARSIDEHRSFERMAMLAQALEAAGCGGCGRGSRSQAMPKRRKTSEEDRHRLWWEKSFKEREELLRERLGQTDPLGYVNSFSWNDPNLIIPGACALCFPPQSVDRHHWLYLGHGLTQPLEPQPPIPGRWSGYGCEFGILTRDTSPWAVDLRTHTPSRPSSASHRLPGGSVHCRGQLSAP